MERKVTILIRFDFSLFGIAGALTLRLT